MDNPSDEDAATKTRDVRYCRECGADIDELRLEILPNTTTCTACSTEQKRVGFLVFSHKTAPDIVMVDGADKEAVRIARRGYERAR